MPSASPVPVSRGLLALFGSFEGRIGRIPFWVGSIAVAIGLALCEIALRQLGGTRAGSWVLVATGLAIYPLAALAAKRGLDRGRSAYWGVILVLLSAGAGLVAGLATLPAGKALLPLAAGMKQASIFAWLILAFDLGLMPGRPAPAARSYRAAA